MRPDIADPAGAIEEGRVRVDGAIMQNPRSRVPFGCAIVVTEPTALRGNAKLRAALDHFGVNVEGRVCLDVGAAAGGFTTALLERGAKRVYAVDAGHGQLLGSLRQDQRVVNLEATNVADLTTAVITEPVGLVTIDVSYLPLASAVLQLDRITISAGADLVGLVKPMFELKLSTAPTDHRRLLSAIDAAIGAIDPARWRVAGTMESPEKGAKGAIEGFVHLVSTR